MEALIEKLSKNKRDSILDLKVYKEPTKTNKRALIEYFGEPIASYVMDLFKKGKIFQYNTGIVANENGDFFMGLHQYKIYQTASSSASASQKPSSSASASSHRKYRVLMSLIVDPEYYVKTSTSKRPPHPTPARSARRPPVSYVPLTIEVGFEVIGTGYGEIYTSSLTHYLEDQFPLHPEQEGGVKTNKKKSTKSIP